MKLEEILASVSERGAPLVIVETRKKEYEKSLTEVQASARDVLGSPLMIHAVTPDEFPSFQKSHEDMLRKSTILVSGIGTPEGLFDLKYMAIALSLVNKIRETFPESESSLVLPAYHGTVKRAIDQVLGLLCEKPEEAKIIEGESDYTFNTSIVQTIARNLGVLKHNVGSLRDAKFMDYLSSQFAQGCNQTTTEKTFLCINDKLKEKKGKFKVVEHKTDPSTLELDGFYAVLVDNAWEEESKGRLGKGIKTLERLSSEISKRRIKLPIIYQTAHPLSDITPEERERITAFPNTFLVPKNIAPKVSKSRAVADKELEASRLLQQNADISLYVVKTVPIGPQGTIKVGQRFLTFSESAIIPTSADSTKIRIYDQAGIEEETDDNHKMYVLAQLHTTLSNQLENPVFRVVGLNFKDFKEIKAKIVSSNPELEQRLSGLKAAYESIVSRHSQIPPSAVIHGDAKWDNWFQGCVLGDFGSMCVGNEYRDVATALMNPSDDFSRTLDRESINKGIYEYIALRKAMHPSFNPDKEKFRRNVYESIVVESLRRAYYKIDTNKELSLNLVNVAESYAGEVTSAQNQECRIC